MARRNQNLAGLAALGALGYMLRGNKAPVETREGVPVSRDDQDFAAMDASLASMRPQAGNPSSEAIYDETGAVSPFRRNLETNELFDPRGVSSSVGRGVGATPARVAPARSAPAPVAQPARQMTREQLINQIPTDAGRYAPVSGERVTGNTLSRNIETTLNAPVPGFVPIRGAYRAATGAQSASRALAPRAVEETPVTFLGRSGARAMGEPERIGVSATRQLGSEPGKLASEPGKLTGPSKRSLVERDRAARAAAREIEREEFNRRGVDRFMDSTFEGGMKKGGKVKAKIKAKPAKKMASGGTAKSSVSKRADGIATKGKTKCKMY